MLTVTLFLFANNWKQPNCPLTDECINKLCNIDIMEHYSTIKRKKLLSTKQISKALG